MGVRTIENSTGEVHEFHIHQIHFQVLAVNGKQDSACASGNGTTPIRCPTTKAREYPSIRVRMDFRGAVVGEFVVSSAHILDHEEAA